MHWLDHRGWSMGCGSHMDRLKVNELTLTVSKVNTYTYQDWPLFIGA